MRFKSVYVLLGVGCGILGAGCRTTWEPKPAGLQGLTDGQNSVPETVIDPKNGYMSNRWIGLQSRSSGRCLEVRGWTGEPLLDPKSARDALIRELGLDRFCVYTPKSKSSPVPRFVPPPGLEAERDRLSISAAGADLVQESPLTSTTQLDKVDAVLAQEFLTQAGQMSPLPGLTSGSPKVQITVLDSEPDGPLRLSLPTPPGPQHGFAVAHLTQGLVGDGTGAVKVLDKRALNNILDKSALNNNDILKTVPVGEAGSIGTISDLGKAIIAAVKECEPRKHLILNLSIGWDGETPLDGLRTDLAARKVSELEPSVQLVYRALQLAARKGVLVIAAAGNRRGGSLHDSNWPVLPAAWELRRPSRWPFGPPLIYAVGGVDWQGLPLPNSRTNGLPRRVAYGDHATVSVNGTPTPVYTGTSISTAVVSATAAVIWHLRPELKPAEVMGLIDSSGETQDARADFYPGSQSSPPPPAPQIREISLCAAVKVACSTYGLNCPTMTCPQPHQPPPLSALLSQPDPGSGTPFQPTGFPSLPPSLPPCHQGTVLLTAAGDPPVVQPVCPTDQCSSISARPWVFPQPGDDPCPNCTLVPTGPPQHASSLAPSVFAGPSVFARISDVSSGPQLYQLAIALNQSWLAALQEDASLNVTAMLDIDCFVPDQPMKRTTYPVQIDYHTNRAWTAFGFGDGQSLKGCRAQLNFVVQDESGKEWSVQNPVVVDPDFSVGPDKSIVVPSTKVVTAGEKERKRATAPPF